MAHEVQYEKHAWVTEVMEVCVLQALMWGSSNIMLEQDMCGQQYPT